jgi:ABC-2 type transport system ATP-binding protein
MTTTHREPAGPPATEPTSAVAPAIEARGLSKHYGSQAAIEGVDLTVAPGEVLGFIGPNGAGKSTFLRLVAGLTRPTSGSISVLGQDPAVRVPDGIAVVVEHLRLVPTLSARRNLRLLAAVRGIADDDDIDAALRAVGLEPESRKRAGAFSLGMRQRLAIAQAIMERPRLLLLDEPTNGLDPEAIIALRDLIRRQADGGTAVVLASHLLTEVERVCDRVVLVSRGTVRRDLDLRATVGLLVRVSGGEQHAGGLRAWADATGVPVEPIVGGRWWAIRDPRPPAELLAAVVTAGVPVEEARPGAAALEEEFLHILDGRPAL